ncbi:hypothetical protein PV516_18805 [Streptomyces scabiei]|uniref:hypothetical protein n=1 Tax=Streptomyces scabiei TaxID=1930 RepID=UPI0029B71F67|nr:hypothetical protein [Streptomyces scabiei]MDX3165837.1 hypothetical protein [Streptomyces scabiei]
MDLENATADKVFEAALKATFRRTNLGMTAAVSVDGYSYRVIVGDTYRAYTDYREGYGGTEPVYANATPEQDQALRAAIAAQPAK